MIQEEILIDGRFYVASLRLRSAIKLQQKPLGAVFFVMAKLGFSSSSTKTFEGVPGVVILRPSIDDEHPRSKSSTNTECICSAAIL